MKAHTINSFFRRGVVTAGANWGAIIADIWDYGSTIKIWLAEHYKFVMIAQTCRLITTEVKPPRLMKWIGRSSLWSGLRLPF